MLKNRNKPVNIMNWYGKNLNQEIGRGRTKKSLVTEKEVDKIPKKWKSPGVDEIKKLLNKITTSSIQTG